MTAATRIVDPMTGLVSIDTVIGTTGAHTMTGTSTTIPPTTTVTAAGKDPVIGPMTTMTVIATGDPAKVVGQHPPRTGRIRDPAP